MTNDEMRIAVAEACGWTDCQRRENACDPAWCKELTGFFSAKSYPQDLPRYTEDLNAMHKAENTCIRGHHDMEYRETLEQVCGDGYAAIIYASSIQRCEAFLKVLGKWKPEHAE